MEDYAMLLEMIINEMSLIAADETTDTKKLSQLIDSAKQFVDGPNKAAFTRALNICKKYISSKRRYVTPLNKLGRYEYPSTKEEIVINKARVNRSINVMASRYCKHVMSL